jgi:hypothetical protein
MLRLSWLVEFGEITRAYCGADVETWSVGLAEGCWDGDFANISDLQHANMFGSAMVRQGEHWWFYPPSHSREAIYAIKNGNITCLSNSLVSLFAHLDFHPDHRTPFTRRLCGMVEGIDSAPTVLMETQGMIIYRFLYYPFIYDGKFFTRQARHIPAGFNNFASYRAYLSSVLAACHANALDSRRRTRYSLVTTCSRGYDSSAVAVLASELGCKRAITISNGRDGQDDSGAPIAEYLGMECVERSRLNTPRAWEETEFLATGFGGGDYQFKQFEDELRGALLLTGYEDGYVWRLPPRPANTNLRRRDTSGNSMAEFRLRTGFFHIPVPVIAATAGPRIQAISASTEMVPWKIGGAYDKPIPRRILEDAGISRSHFAVEKSAVASVIRGAKQLSDAARADFDAFRQPRVNPILLRLHELHFRFGNMLFRIIRRLMDVYPLHGHVMRFIRTNVASNYATPGMSFHANLLFCWAVDRLIKNKKKETWNQELELVNSADYSGPCSNASENIGPPLQNH